MSKRSWGAALALALRAVERQILCHSCSRRPLGVVQPRISDSFDYQGEVAVVLGKRGRHIQPVDALDWAGL